MREVWIQCFGVPLHGWSVKVSEAIGRKFREVVEVSKDTLDKLNMEFGRVMVKEALGLKSKGKKDEEGHPFVLRGGANYG
ncbi:hypothetical protein MRB53_002011 [Persea americana]|uniref:Uncharacterized protein n=1 Tax=Persea americana TaxID=3435 RepID=A0ACC2MU83_PERAE|nr:hypothetical protein MRB53_002011 [Persea americana]